MAKKKASGSESRRLNTLVRMDDEVVATGRKIAALRNQSLGELFAELLRPALKREWDKEVRKMTRGE